MNLFLTLLIHIFKGFGNKSFAEIVQLSQLDIEGKPVHQCVHCIEDMQYFMGLCTVVHSSIILFKHSSFSLAVSCYYTPAQKESGYTVLLLCVCLSVTIILIFCRSFS